MPKLDRATAIMVNKADTSGRALLPEGEYLAKLVKCTVSSKNDRNGNKYWVWEFEVVEEGDFKGSKLSVNTGLAENQHWFMKLVFEAFGAKPNVDTDTLLGHEVTLVVDQHEISGGARKGKLANGIVSLMPPGQSAADGEDDPFGEEGGEGETEPDF
jgi:hypothetical protein